jgi:hypothetical protein
MRNAGLVISLVLLVLLQYKEASSNDTPRPSIQILLVYDQSASMNWRVRENSVMKPGYAVKQRDATIAFLKSLPPPSCIPINMVYIPWGDAPQKFDPVTISSAADVPRMIRLITTYGATDYGNSNITAALEEAYSQLDQNAIERIVIFTTNGVGSLETASLSASFSHQTTFYGVSIGDERVRTTVHDYIVPPQQHHVHIPEYEQFEQAIGDIFKEINDHLNALCAVS